MNVQTTGAQIRDLGRVLPWMAAPPRDQSEDFAAVLTPEALTSMSGEQRKDLIKALVWSCEQRLAGVAAALQKMTTELKLARNLKAEDLLVAFADPDGEVTDSCEKAEAHFRSERERLQALRDNLLASGGLALYDPRVFVAIDALYAAFGSVVSCMQESRWLILMAEGGRDAPSSDRTFASGAALVAAIEAGAAEVA